jgi:hypothetical protein
MPLDFSSSVPMFCDDKSASNPAPEENEELVDYNCSLERMNFDINVIHMSTDGYVLSEEDVVHLDFGPKEAIFLKPKVTENHLKALYLKGHINGKPVSRMLVDGGAGGPIRRPERGEGMNRRRYKFFSKERTRPIPQIHNQGFPNEFAKVA